MKFTDYDKYIKSTGTHYISNSGSDENKKISGGQAGDQTGHEWELKSWYSRPWTVVLRYEKDPRAGYLMACLSSAAALNNKIGYDQTQRKTYFTQLEKVKYDPSAIKTACEEDCTAGVTSNYKAVGHILGIDSLKNLSLSIYSKTMRSNFEKAGFTALTDSKYLKSAKYLLPGDVLLYEGHHAAANVSLGSSVKSSYKFPNMTGVNVPLTTVAPVIDTQVETAQPSKIISYALALRAMNIRDKASTDGNVLNVIEKHKIASVIEILSNGWMRVKYGDTEGYTSNRGNQFFVLCDTKNFMQVINGKLNARSGASTTYPSLKILNNGEIVGTYAEKNGWVKVSKNPELWSSAKYLKKI